MIEIISYIPFDKIGWTVLHFYWISTIFSGIIALILRLLEKPLLRYHVAQGALVVLLLLPVALWIEKPEPAPEKTNLSANVSSTVSRIPESTPSASVDKRQFPTENTSSEKTDHTIKRGETVLELSFLSELATTKIAPLYPWIGGIYVIGSMLMFFYLIGGLWLIVRKNNSYRPLDNIRWRRICRHLANKLSISDRIQLLSSDNIATPCVVGFYRPSVWIPSRLADQLNESQIRALLAHELVHIKRKDYLKGLIQQIALAILFVQPMVWWLVKKLQQQREFICDQESAVLHQNRYRYASTLVQIKKDCRGRLNSALAGISATEHQLVKRIRRLTSVSEAKNQKLKPSISISLALLMLISVFGMGWTSFQLDFESQSGFTVELDQRKPNPYNGGGMEVLFPWNQLDKETRNAAVLPDLNEDARKSFAKIKFTGNPDSRTSDEIIALFVNPASVSPTVYVDKNQNLDFTDDGGQHEFSNSGLTVEFPHNGIENAKHIIRWTKMEHSKIAALKERPDHWTNQYTYITIVRNERLNHSTGHWQYNGKTYSLTLIDRNLNGIFGEKNIGFLAVNNAYQATLDERKSYFLSEQPTLTIGSVRFKVVEINPDGSEVRLKRVES